MHYVKILVTRGPMEKIATVRLEHEAPLLAVLHGDDNVEVGEPVKARPPETTVEAEHARLIRAYGNHPDAHVPIVEHVYGHPRTGKLAEAMGLDDPDDLSRRTVAELKALAEEAGIAVEPNAKKKELIEALQAA